MLHYLRKNGFELETVFPGYFLLQGGAAGILVGVLSFLFILVMNSSSRSEEDSLSWILYGGLFNLLYALLSCVVCSTFLCEVLTTVLRFFSWLLKLRMKIVTRILSVTLLTSCLFFYLFRLDQGQMTERSLILLVIGIALVSIPTGSLCGSGIELWKMFSFGTVLVRRSGFNWRVSSESRFATAAMFPIRFFSFFGLAICGVIIICLRYSWHNTYVFIGASSFLIYLVASLYLSYRSPRPWILIVLACLLNVPITVLAAWTYVQKASPLDQVTRPFIVFIATLAISSALCVGVRAGISIRENLLNRRVDEMKGFDSAMYEILQMN